MKLHADTRHTSLRFQRAEHGPLLRRCSELRYQVYCLDRGFLPREAYPDGTETDEFDGHAMHFAALERTGRVVGTARVILHSSAGLPLEHYFSEEGGLHFHGVPRNLIGEVSRLAVRGPTRKLDDGQVNTRSPRRSEIALGLYGEIYRASRKAGLTHLLAAMERPLVRLLSRHSFPFQAVGPEIDYYGPVRPYLLDITHGERALFHKCPDTMNRFANGLPQDLLPAWFSPSTTG